MKNQQSYIDNALKYTAQKGYEKKGAEFLKLSTKYLSELFKVCYVLISEYSKNTPNMVKSTAFYGNGCFLPNITYKLKHTPCKNVIDTKICTYPKNVQSLFPKDKSLEQMNAEGYVGIPLWSSVGEPIGLIVLLDDKEIKDTKTIEIVSQIIAIKVAQVIEKQLYEKKIKRQIKDLEVSNKKLEESELRFKMLANKTSDGYTVADLKGNYVFVNPAFCKMSGYSEEELLKMTVFDVKAKNQSHISFYNSRTSMKGIPIRVNLQRKNGEEFLTEIVGDNIIINGDKLVLGTIRDISKQVKIEEELKSSRQNYKQLFEKNPASLWEMDFTKGHQKLQDLKQRGINNIEGYLKDNPQFLIECHASIRMVHVNEATVNFFKAKSKEDLLRNVEKLVTKATLLYYQKVLIEIFNGETEITQEISFKNLLDQVILGVVKLNLIKAKDNSVVTAHISIIDITKQRESEERYRSLSEASFDAIFISENGICIEQNSAAQKMFGYTNKEAKGMSAVDLIDLKSQELVLKNIKSNNENPYEVIALRKDGTTFEAEIRARMIMHKGRKVRVSSFSDVTLRKKLEEKLIKNEEKFKKLSNLTFEGILIHNEGVVIDSNLSFEKMFGYNHKEIYGKDITKIIYPKKYHKIIFKNRINKHTHAYEIEGIRKDGAVFPIEVEARNIRINNQETLRVTAFRDITVRKKSEKEYLKLFTAVKQSANTIVITDLEGNIEYTNPKFTELTGYTTEEAIGQNPRIINSGKQSKAYYAKMWKTITAGKIWNGEFCNKSKSGNLFWEQVTITPIKNEEGVIINYLAVKEDITNRKLDEQKLTEAFKKIEESEKKFRELYEKSGDAILIIKNGIFTDCNQASVKMLGYNSKEFFLNVHPSKLSPKQQPDGVKSSEKADLMMKTALEKGTYRFEWVHTKKNGECFPVEVLLTAISNNPTNEVLHCVWRDITERKKAENSLNNAFKTIKESEEALKTILNTANEGFWMINTKAITTKINPKMCTILGYSENDILEKSIFEFVDEENAKIFKEQLKLRDSGVASTYEIVLKPKNGKDLVCLFKTSPTFDKENRRTGSFAMVTDISKIKTAYNKLENKNNELTKLSDELSIKNSLLIESKNKFKNIFDKSPVSLWEQDFSEVIKLLNEKKSEGVDLEKYLSENQDFVIECISKIKVLNVNKITLDMLGVKSIEELVTHIRKTNNKISITTLKKELISIVSGKKEFLGETQFIRKDGSKLFTLVKSTMVDDNGKNLASIINITDLKKVEKELIKSKEEAEESNRLKTEFLNNMSHEIRTPMNGILGFTQMLNDPDLDVQKRNTFVNIIQNSGSQLLRIIDDILEISRLGTKQVKVINEEVCLNDVLLELFSIFDIKAKENKTPLYLKKELSDKQSTIITDKTKLNKILSNLLENALKFTNQGFIEFGYTLQNKNNSQQIEIYVKDTGIGISPTKHQLIFERFSQVEKELVKKVGGLGLGLSIAKENTELLGGKISVKSEEMLGATFTVVLPYESVYNEEIVENTKDNHVILIAEDEEVNYMYLETMLKDIMKLNCNVFHVKNGAEAVEFCKNNSKVDLVLMDLKMPILNGYKATKKIREFNPTVPIIAQTAYSTIQDKEKALSVGCNHFVSKPIDKEIFFSIIDKILVN